MHISGRRAFSLIELIVVLLIMGSIGSVIVACFMGGVRAYERARGFGRGEADACLAFDRIEQDLKNAVAVPGTSFAGDIASMRFVTTVAGESGEGGEDVSVIEVGYRADARDGILRETEVFGDKGQGGKVGESIFSGNSRLTLAYYGGGGGQSQPEWMSMWQSSSNLPRQVHVIISGGGLEAGSIERSFVIPVGGEDE